MLFFYFPPTSPYWIPNLIYIQPFFMLLITEIQYPLRWRSRLSNIWYQLARGFMHVLTTNKPRVVTLYFTTTFVVFKFNPIWSKSCVFIRFPGFKMIFDSISDPFFFPKTVILLSFRIDSLIRVIILLHLCHLFYISVRGSASIL